MEGIVLHFDTVSSSGVVRASDGNRYDFSISDWKSSGVPARGDTIDFEPEGGQAREIFVLRSSTGTPAPLLLAMPMDARVRENLGEIALPKELSGNAIKEWIAHHPSQFLAASILILCFLPYVGIPENPITGVKSVSLWGVLSYVGTGIDMLGMAGDQTSGIKMLLRIMYLLYLIPGLAAWLLYKEWSGTADDNFRWRTGMAALCGPIGVPIVMLLLGSMFISSYDRSHLYGMLGSGNGPDVSSFVRFGLLSIMAAGGALVAVSTGWKPFGSSSGQRAEVSGVDRAAKFLFDQGIVSEPVDGASAKLCAQCGHSNMLTDKFCAECGAER